MKQANIAGLVLLVGFMMVLAGCRQAEVPLGSAERKPMSEEGRVEFLDQLGRKELGTEDIYNADGIIINAERYLEVSNWKLNLLAKAYKEQSDVEYITDTYELEGKDEYWMAHHVTTEDFQCDVLLSGNDDSMKLELQLDNVGEYIIVPRGCIINGVLKNTSLFKGSESEKGHFVIKAKMSDFESLNLFGITMENISSIAWLLTAINTETKEMREFLLASSFPVTKEWEGLQIANTFSVADGLIMWVAREGTAAYLCTFNGIESKISSEINVNALGSLISDTYQLDVNSGECVYIFLGYGVAEVEVLLGETLLHKE